MASSSLTLLLGAFSIYGIALFSYVNSNLEHYRSFVGPVLRIAMLVLALVAFGISSQFDIGGFHGDAPIVAAQVGTGAVVFLLYSFAVVPLVNLFGGTSIKRKNVRSPFGRRSELRNHGILLVGDGFVGKSQIIRTISSDYSPIPTRRRTDGFHSISGPTYFSTRLVFYDFRGQDFSKLTDMIEKFSLSDGRINSLVLVVDLFGPPGRRGLSDGEYEILAEKERDTQYDSFDFERRDHHHRRLGSGLLDVLVGKLGVSDSPGLGLKSVCLFVNKMDKWSKWDRTTDNQIVHKEFSKLFEDLTDRFDNSIRLERIAGSALEGIGICGRKSLLENILGPIPDGGPSDAHSR